VGTDRGLRIASLPSGRESAPRAVYLALARALPVLFSPRILAVVFLPLIGAAVFWTVVAWFAWAPLARWLSVVLLGGDSGFSLFAASAFAALLLMLAAVLTVLVAVAVLAMPVIVDAVADRDFPALAKLHGGTFAGSVFNAAAAIAVYFPLWLLALFLLAVPPIYVAVSLLLNAWLNQRLFRYEALALHAGRDEMRAVNSGARGRLFLLGLALAPLSLIPVVNLLVPIYAGIAFTCLCLDELETNRAGALAVAADGNMPVPHRP
jgi:CysZ protein